MAQPRNNYIYTIKGAEIEGGLLVFSPHIINHKYL